MVAVTPMLRRSLAIGVLTVGLGSLPALAQEPRPAPDLRMLLNQPPARGVADSPPAPDLRDLPPGKLDKPASTPPVTIIIGGDPHCDPAEDALAGQRNSRSRRSR